jgi:hypothetical protein
VKRVRTGLISAERKARTTLDQRKQVEHAAETAYADIKAKRRGAFAQHREDALMWKNQGEALIREYRTVNARARTDGKDNFPVVTFDLSSLERLDETCEDLPGGDEEAEAALVARGNGPGAA